MAIETAAALIQVLGQYRLLEPAQLDDVARKIAGKKLDARTLAQKLIEIGWLTPYQVNQLLQGRGKHLVLGSYVLLERLGEGGMGEVFKARHTKMDRVVAIKLIRKERLANEQAVKRFHREIRAAAQLTHPNVVHAFDADQVGDTHIFVMEYVEGTDLAKLVKDSGPLAVSQVCDYIRQAALGLQHALEKGMVHRDIKPHNLLLSRGGAVKILDMGLARVARPDGDDESSSTLTKEGSVMGTLDYIAPEQAMDSHTVDIRADLYSLGCTFYFLLTGRVPFAGGDALAKLMKHKLEEPESLEKLRPEVPAGVAALVRKLMAKRPEDRFQTPAELACVLADGIPAGPVPPLGRQRRAAFRRWPLLAGAGSAALIGLIGLVLFWSRPQPREGPFTEGSLGTKPGELEKPISNSIGMKLALIPRGEFLMGSPDGENERQPQEGPQHKVKITKPFYLGIHEVTVGQFRAFVQASGYRTDAEKDGKGIHRFFPQLPPDKRWQLDPKCNWQNPGWPQDDDHPVVCVTWDDAVAFCQWLSKKEAKSYRLPTEAEWEYACRAGGKTAFHNGEVLSSRQANFNGEKPYGAAEKGPNLEKAEKVGRYAPNAFGLYDMHGNVSESCADLYDEKNNYYPQSPSADPKGPSAGSHRVMRGGCWISSGSGCRSAARGGAPPSIRGVIFGFRAASDP